MSATSISAIRVQLAALRHRSVKLGGQGLTANTLAYLAIAILALGGRSGVIVLIAAIVLCLFFTRLLPPWTAGARNALTGRTPSGALGSYTLPRVVLTTSIAIFATGNSKQPILAWTVAAIFAITIIAEPLIANLSRLPRPISVNAPWDQASTAVPYGTPVIYLTNTVGLLVAALAMMLGAQPLLALVVPAISFGLSTVLIGVNLRCRRVHEQMKKKLNGHVEAYAPRFALYWEAEVGTSYQIEMWLPYLEQLNERFIVILRSPWNLNDVRELTNVPIIVCAAMHELDDVIVPTLRTTFYVNNSIRNCHFVRYPHITHIQLNHGDSDKAPSFNPVVRMYDHNFVAGQAAIDRFAANNIKVREDFFTIVGRPQVAAVRQVEPHRANQKQTVLYAPTWAGFMNDSNYSSLSAGPQIVQELLARELTVIFRPHPHSRKLPTYKHACDQIHALLTADSIAHGRGHLHGQTAETTMSIVDCFNASDAMISDVSSVVPDYLFSEKPLALVAMNSTYEKFLSNNPIATAAYVIDYQLGNLTAILDDALDSDSMQTARVQVKAHYLGDFPAADYEQVFLTEAKKYLV